MSKERALKKPTAKIPVEVNGTMTNEGADRVGLHLAGSLRITAWAGVIAAIALVIAAIPWP